MMVSLQPYEVGSVEGFVSPLLPGTQITGQGRRMTRSQTLDGGVAIYNAGYAAGDLGAQVEIETTSLADVLQGRQLEAQSPDVVLSHPEGVFRAMIQELDTTNQNMIFTLLITEKLS